MASDINPMDTIITMLTTFWDDTQTDSITPQFKKIYDIPKLQRMNNDYVLVYLNNTLFGQPGIGQNTAADVREIVTIDVRVKGTSDAHARKVLRECARVIQINVLDPDSNFNILDPYNQNITDLSDRTRQIYRYVFTVTLTDYFRLNIDYRLPCVLK
jgi:hypothetical protein